MLKNLSILISIVSLILFLHLSPIAVAKHSTCIDGADEGYCDATLDWQHIFSQMDSPETSDLNDEGSNKYRNLYQGIPVVFDDDTQEALTGEEMPSVQHNDDQSYRYTYSEAIGYPEYRYEIHGWGNDGITIDEGDTRKVVSDGTVYQPSWSYRAEKSINKFKVDSAVTTVSLPKNTRLKLNLYSDGEKDNLVATATYDPEDYRSAGSLSSKITDVHLEDGASYNPVYYVEPVLERDNTNIESPVLGNNTVLRRNLPDFRIISKPYNNYPGETLSEYNEYMAKEFESEYGSNNQDSYAPRINNFASAQTSNAGFDSNTNVFHNTFSKIAYVDNSFRISYDYESLDENNFEEHMVTKDGKIHVNYDSGVSGPPNNGDWIYGSGVSQNSPDDGDRRWEYSRDDIKYEIEVGYQYTRDRFNNEQSEIETIQEDEAGHISVNYDEDDYSDDINSFYAQINVQVKYDKDYEEYEIEEEDCPANLSPMDEDYEDWVDEDDCDNPNDDYVESEYWTSLNDNSLDECVQIAMGYELISNDASCDEITLGEPEVTRRSDYEVMDTSETYSFDEDKIDMYSAHMSDGVSTRVHKEEGTIWTDLESKQYTISKTVFVDNEDISDQIVNVPTVRSTPKDAGEETYDIGGEEYNFNTNDYTSIDGQIEDQNVYLDLYTTGPLTNSDEITVSVDDNQVYSGTVNHNRDDHIEFKKLKENIDITSEVQDKSIINIDFEKQGSEDDVRIDYDIRIESDKTISKLSSRWKYATFRDYRWEQIYRYTQKCTSDNCDDYAKHGRYIANDGERFFPDPAEIPSSDQQGVYYFSPSKSLPVQAYLVPTSRSIETGVRSGYQERIEVIPETSIESTYGEEYDSDDRYPDPDKFHLDQDNPEESIDNIGDGIKPGVYEGKIYSNACPYEHGASNEDDNEDQYCGLTEAHAADIYNEIKLYSRLDVDIDDIDLESYVEAAENAEEQDTQENSDVREGVEAFKSPYQYGSYSNLEYDHLKGGTPKGPNHILSGTKRYYPEYTKFTIETTGSSKWQVSGKSPWSEQNIQNEKEFKFDSVNFNVKRINDLSEHFEDKEYTKEELENRENQYDFAQYHEFVDDSIYESIPRDDLVQVRIQVTDEHNKPINFEARRNSQYDLHGTIRVTNSIYASDTSTWASGAYTPNENGFVYIVVPDQNTIDDNLEIRFSGDEYEWWKLNENARLLESSSVEFNAVNSFEEEEEGDNSSGNPWLFIIFAVYALAFMASAMFKATGSDYTVVDILKIPVELFNPGGDGIPGSDMLLKFIELFIIFTAILAFSPGTGNPLALFEPFANFFNVIIDYILF